MREWREVSVGAHLKLTSGFPFASSHFSNEGTPLIRIRDLLTSSTETYFNGAFPPGYIVKQGNILIGMDGDFHIVRWSGCDALLNQRVLKIDVQDESVVVLDYLYHWLVPFIKQVNDVTAATTVKHLSTKDLTSAKACLPSVGLQRKIAAILTSIDTAIEKTEALIAKYHQIKAGLMHDLFTRGVLLDGTLRPVRENAPELYQDTVIGWLPREWTLTKLGRVLTRIDAGWSPECQETPPGTDEWGVLKVSAVTKGIYDSSESKVLPLSMTPDSSLEVADDDVILARANGVAQLVGVTVQVKNTPSKLMLSDKLLRLVPNLSFMTKDFLAQLMRANPIALQIESAMNGSSGQRNISQAQIRNFDCIAPTIHEQKLIASKLRAVELSIEHENITKKKLKHQKLGLMQDLLTGKVPVEPAPEPLDTTDA